MKMKPDLCQNQCEQLARIMLEKITPDFLCENIEMCPQKIYWPLRAMSGFMYP
jgi:hypothetical protein